MKKILKLIPFAIFVGVIAFTISNRIKNDYDIRGAKNVRTVLNQREVDSFREQMVSREASYLVWPGLRSLQVSWIWLEALQGLHTDSSFEGDFSWLFAKLYKLVNLTPKEERVMINALASFFFVIGKDNAGQMLFMNELIKRSPKSWKTWFTSGFFAMDVLNDNQMASEFMTQAAYFGGPQYSAALALKLKYGEDALDAEEKRDLILKSVPPEMIEILKKTRPTWFN